MMYSNQQFIKASNLIEKKNYSEAITILEKLFKKDKNNKDYLTRIIFCYFELKKYQESIIFMKYLQDLDPTNIQNYFNLGYCYQIKGDYVSAKKSYLKIIEIDKKNVQAYLTLGSMLKNINKFDEALEIYKVAISEKIYSNKIYTNISSVYIELKEYLRALDFANKALSLDANDYLALNNLGVIYINQKKFEEAIKYLNFALKIKNQDPLVYLNLGIFYKNQNNEAEAIKYFDKCISLDNNYSDAHLYKALIHLSNNNFIEGWKGYENRWLKQKKNVSSNLPLWSPNKNFKHILIWGEQGLGEQILFCSIIKDLEKNFKKITLIVNIKLKKILQEAFNNIEVLSFDDDWSSNKADCQIPLGSLGYFYRNSKNDFPLSKKILEINFKQQYFPKKKLRCGLSWKSVNSVESDSKSINLNELKNILKLNEYIDFYDIQYTDENKNLKLLKEEGLEINKIPGLDPFNNLYHLSEVICSMDFIVTISNTTAHLSASLGVPTFVLLSKNIGKLWYWSNNINDKNLWYPNAKIFRQKTQGVWEHPTNDLEKFIFKYLINL